MVADAKCTGHLSVLSTTIHQVVHAQYSDASNDDNMEMIFDD